MANQNKPPPPDDDRRWVCVPQYVHYRTGKLMVAKEYGYDCWRFPVRKK